MGGMNMEAPARKLLKVVSIIYIVIGYTSLLISIVSIGGANFWAGGMRGLRGELVVIFIAVVCLALGASITVIIIGKMGLSRCGNVEKADFFITTGTVLMVLIGLGVVASIIKGNFNGLPLFGSILPLLYISGGQKNRDAANEAPPPEPQEADASQLQQEADASQLQPETDASQLQQQSDDTPLQ